MVPIRKRIQTYANAVTSPRKSATYKGTYYRVTGVVNTQINTTVGVKECP